MKPAWRERSIRLQRKGFLKASPPVWTWENVFYERELGVYEAAVRPVDRMIRINLSLIFVMIFAIPVAHKLGIPTTIKLFYLPLFVNILFATCVFPCIHALRAFHRIQVVSSDLFVSDIAVLPPEMRPIKELISRLHLTEPARQSFTRILKITIIYFCALYLLQVVAAGSWSLVNPFLILMIGILSSIYLILFYGLCLLFRSFTYFLVFSILASNPWIGWNMAAFCLSHRYEHFPLRGKTAFLTKWQLNEDL